MGEMIEQKPQLCLVKTDFFLFSESDFILEGSSVEVKDQLNSTDCTLMLLSMLQ